MRIRIEHNHGFLILDDAMVVESPWTDSGGVLRIGRVVTGTVVDGATYSRLFGATSVKRITPGTTASYTIWGRDIVPQADGSMRVDCCFCG